MTTLRYILYRTGRLFTVNPFGCALIWAILIGVLLAIIVNVGKM